MFHIKNMVGLKINYETRIIRIKSKLYTESFYSEFWPSGYLKFNQLFTSVYRAELSDTVSDNFINYFDSIVFTEDIHIGFNQFH